MVITLDKVLKTIKNIILYWPSAGVRVKKKIAKYYD